MTPNQLKANVVALDLPFKPEYEKPLPNPLVPKGYGDGQA